MLKIFKSIKKFFLPLQNQDHSPRLDRTLSPTNSLNVMRNVFSAMDASRVTEDQHRKNLEDIELARLKHDREAVNNNLKAQHRVLMVTLAATFIALFSSVTAIYIAMNDEDPKPPVVNVAPSQPDVNVYVPEPKPAQSQ